MRYALKIHEDNRIGYACVVLPNGKYDGMPIVADLPDGDITDYLYIDGEYVYNPLPNPEEPDPEEPAEETTVWDELDAAYQEGVDSV